MYQRIISYILIAWIVSSCTQGEPPIVFNQNESAGPGKTFGLQGNRFGEKPEVKYCVINGKERRPKPSGSLSVVTGSDMNLSAVMPKDIEEGSLVAVWIKNGRLMSEPVFINRARIVTVEYEDVVPGGIMRVFGRNLSFPPRSPEVTLQDVLSGEIFPAEIVCHESYILTLRTPEAIQPGRKYRIRVTNGAGGKWGETFAEEKITGVAKGADPFGLGVPWAGTFTFHQNIYNVQTDSRLKLKAKGDGLVNDQEAIRQAIDRAHEDGGGVVYLPEGKYRIEMPSGNGITMKSNVVIKGDGPAQTFIQYGYGTIRLDSGSVVNNPGSTVGMLFLWPSGTHHTGLTGLTFQNVETKGRWEHCLRTMPMPDKRKQGEGGTHYFAANCRFDLTVVGGLMWFSVDRMAIVDCQFNYTPKANWPGFWLTWPWVWYFDGVSNYVVRNNRVHYSAGRFGFNNSFNGIIENNHITRYSDLQTERGETGGFNIDYAKDIVVLANRMNVSGPPLIPRNDGETILSQGCDPFGQSLGQVTDATPLTVTDAKQKWPALRTATVDPEEHHAILPCISSIVAIVAGPGTGQWRYIVGNDETNLYIHKPWDVVPDSASRYVVTEWSAEDWLIKDNILDDNHQGIMLYCGGMDVAITGNKLTNSTGIWVRSDQRTLATRYNLSWNIAINENKVVNTSGIRSAYVTMSHVKVTNDNSEIFGTGTIGIEMRRNFVQASVPNVVSNIFTEGYHNCVSCGNADKSPCDLSKVAILGTIIEDNIAVNTDNAYQTGAGAYNTVIVPGKMESVSTFVKEINGEAQNSYFLNK